jgi:hypothetical protein
MLQKILNVALCLVALSACDRASAGSGDPVTGEVPSAGIVDSTFSPEEQLRRFRVGIDGAPEGLSGGTDSRETLVRRFADALETHDTTAFREIVLSRAEFAYLYYPDSRHTRPPLRQDPGLVWMLLQQNSEKGIVRALRRYGGEPLGYRSYRCDPEPEREGENTVWTGCVITATFGGSDTTSFQLFGSIVERDGHFKFVSYANML